MSDIAIKVENISKKYQIGENKNFPTLRDKLMELPNRLFKGPKKTKEFWALKDVSFEVKRGEVVGIIGRNGAGKSTMLKILARITEPTSGKITMYGRVASMLEVGTGFNPELTGRENIYLNGAIIGMKKSEIKSKFDDIVEFSGVDKFLDTPVKHYSSGMYIRLAFAVAAHLDADILLVDEVLAVGDAEFQKKCLGKMSDLAESGRTVIFVSHNIRAIQTLCKKVVHLDGGTLSAIGKTEEIVLRYMKKNYVKDSQEKFTISKKLLFTKTVKLNKLEIFNADLKKKTFSVNSEIGITLHYQVRKQTDRLGFTILVKDYNSGEIVFSSISNSEQDWYFKTLQPGHYQTTCIIPKNILNNSMYQIDLCTFNKGFLEFAQLENAITIKIDDSQDYRYDYSGSYVGFVRPYLEWKTLKE